MNKRFLYLVTLASCLFATSLQADSKGEPAKKAADRSHADPTSQKQPVSGIRFPESYVEFYRQVLANARSSSLVNFKTDAALADVAVRLWKKTGDPECKTEAIDYFSRSISAPDFDLKDFHILHHFGELVSLMKEEGLLTPEQKKKVSEIARSVLAEYLRQPDDAKLHTGIQLYNIRMGQIAGYAGLLRYLKDEPFDKREAVSRKLNSYFDLLCLTGNPEEDASNYDSLCMAFAIDLARLLGREKDLISPVFKRCLENFREVTSPSGIIPEYGDSYFTYDGMPMDRLYLMEFAARLFNDSSFAEACRKMRNRPLMKNAPGDMWVRSMNLIEMDKPFPTDERNQAPLAQVLPHNTSEDGKTIKAVPDKLILRTGNSPGDAMILMDLYAAGSHAAKDKGPSIAYYESHQVPLFHNMGRRGTRSAITGNICWALPAQERFPGLWHPGEWFTQCIPAELIATNKAGQHCLSSIFLRNFQGHPDNKRCASLSFDNLRLEGSSETRLIDGFESADGWGANLLQLTQPQNSTDRTEGEFSQQVSWKEVKADGVTRKPPTDHLEPFAKKQFETLKLDMKYTGTRPYVLLRGLGESGEELELGDKVLRPELKDAAVEQRGSDAFGQILYNRYVTEDSSLSRRIVLTKEGYLIVRDNLLPGTTMNGWNGGQLWQLYTLEAKGDHWFCSCDDGAYPDVTGKPGANPQRRMLVRFAADHDTRADSEKVERTITYPNPKGIPPTSYVTTFSQRKVIAGQPAIFGMVVVPVEPGVSPGTLAENITVTTAGDGTVQTVIKYASRTVTIRIDDKDWSVTRHPTTNPSAGCLGTDLEGGITTFKEWKRMLLAETWR